MREERINDHEIVLVPDEQPMSIDCPHALSQSEKYDRSVLKGYYATYATNSYGSHNHRIPHKGRSKFSKFFK